MSTTHQTLRTEVGPGVHVAETGADLGTAATVLSRAFYDDPVLSWLCPDAERRRTVLPKWFSIIAENLAHHRGIHVTADAAGATVWVPPGQPMVEDPEPFQTAMVEASPPDAERFGTMLGKAEVVHPEEPHWYLFFIGTVPERQGEGVGSRLLQAVLDQCDQEGIPAYLESTCRQNERLYERHGFEVTGEIALPDGPTPRTMWRAPARP